VQVSVIINCFNSELFIKDSIISVLNQTYKNFELIIFDNCSTDNTAKIIKSFKDTRIKYFKSEKKHSLGKARDLATKKSKNKWVAFIDSDDLWVSTKLSEQVELVNINRSIGLVYTDFLYIDKESSVLKKKSYTKFYDKSVFENLLNENYICFSSVFFNKKIIKSKNFFNPILKNSEDFDLLLKITQKNSLGYIKKKLVKYRVHENNLTKFQTKRSFSEWQYLIYLYSKNHIKEKKKIKIKYKLQKLKIRISSKYVFIWKFFRKIF
jgi:glycosyltransferase involved in cell wall biosynthesis